MSRERWNHIMEKHPNVNSLELIRNTLESPSFIKKDKFDHLVNYYYKYFKNKNNYLLVVVKYLNGNGFILTSFYTKTIK